jgi:release factor glutamine methyltransferase
VSSIADTLAAAVARLARAGVGSPRFDAELLMARLLGTDRGGLFVRREDALDPATAERFVEWIARREGREPLQHITGTQEFHGLEFRCDRRALVPRPETEGLCDAALELVAPGAAHVVDLGTGSGCIAVTLAVKRPELRVHALDRSPAAVELARENACMHAVSDRIEWVVGEMTSPPSSWSESMDAVVSNPPYVTEADWGRLEPEVREHDPREALVAGPSGLEAYEALVAPAATLLRTGGVLILELGYGQAERVRSIVGAAPFETVAVRPDLRGIPRVLVARRARGRR